jgi:hypothetical protein
MDGPDQLDTDGMPQAIHRGRLRQAHPNPEIAQVIRDDSLLCLAPTTIQHGPADALPEECSGKGPDVLA